MLKVGDRIRIISKCWLYGTVGTVNFVSQGIERLISITLDDDNVISFGCWEVEIVK